MVCALTTVNKGVPANSAPSGAAGMAYSLRIFVHEISDVPGAQLFQ